MKEIYLAGGCFWGLQKFFDQFDGVVSTEVGYANGPDNRDGHSPTYEEVCRSSGHAETVKIIYDEKRISLPELLRFYFMVIDPLSVNRQGNDRGIQYRTGIYYTDSEQLQEIRPVYDAEQDKAGKPLAVELEQIRNFFSAEEYHQKYLENRKDHRNISVSVVLFHLCLFLIRWVSNRLVTVISSVITVFQQSVFHTTTDKP